MVSVASERKLRYSVEVQKAVREKQLHFKT